jgi:hypothetical protein
MATCSAQILHEGVACGPAITNAEIFGSSSDEESDDDADPEDADTERGNGFWQQLSTSPLSQLPPRTFCSRCCYLTYEAEVATAMPVRIVDLEFDHSIAVGKVGLPRVLAELRAGFRRNDAVARALREASRTVRKKPLSTISIETMLRMHGEVITMLNIDLGILYAAGALAESPASATGRILAGTSPEWRGEPRTWHRAIAKVKSVYSAYYRPTDGLARDQRMPPRWLTQVKAVAHEVFPVCAGS